jgi:hypothetical protein
MAQACNSASVIFVGRGFGRDIHSMQKLGFSP